MIIDGSLTIAKKKKHELVDELRRLKFKPIPKVKDAKKQGEMEPVVDTAANADVDADDDASGDGSDYDYLAGVSLRSDSP